MPQPLLTNDVGVILTIGGILNGERVTCVEPYVLDQASPDANTICEDLFNSWAAGPRTEWLAMLSPDYALVFLQCEGMIDGKIPFRDDFTLTAFPGTGTGSSLPSQVAGLLVHYEEPADVVPGHRIGVAKSFIAGIPDGNVIGQTVQSAQITLMENYALDVRPGFSSVLYPTKKWYRCLSAPRPRTPGTNCKRIAASIARGYLGTQKRRLLPH